MATFDRRDLERLRHTPGEALLSRDFRGQAAMDEQARWWHVRGAHGAYGVALGLLTRAWSAAGPPALILVSPGVAFDAFGRELLLSGVQQVAVPALPAGGSLTLVLCYRRDGGAVEDLSGACPGDAPPPFATAELVWLPSPTPLDGVPLGRLTVPVGGGPTWSQDFRPPAARPFARPRIGSGATVAGATAWEPWQIGETASDRRALGIQVRIDTRAAGFTRVPCYFAWVQGNDFAGKPPVVSLPEAEFIAEARSTGFLFRTRLYRPDQAGSSLFASIPPPSQVALARRSLAVCWLGIQGSRLALYGRSELELLAEVMIHEHS